MSRYKLLKYAKDSLDETKINWQIVDRELRDALQNYNDIRVPGKNQPLFMDLIINIIVRKYGLRGIDLQSYGQFE